MDRAKTVYLSLSSDTTLEYLELMPQKQSFLNVKNIGEKCLLFLQQRSHPAPILN
jgi:hypothetical protein